MEDKKNNSIYYPMLVSEVGTAEFVQEDIESLRWKKFKTLSEMNRKILISSDLSQKLMDFQDASSLDDLLVGQISNIIRKIFFEEINLGGVEGEINVILAQKSYQINPEKIIDFIKNEILTIKPTEEKEFDEDEEQAKKDKEEEVRAWQAKIDNLPLGKALEKYPNLGEQAVTLNLLRIQGSSDLVKPSIKNWINDYRSALGSGKHSTIDRGNYLFHSENGKRLTPGERQKVSLTLKSLDEETPLEIDGDAQQIIFKLVVETPLQSNNPLPQQPAIAPKVSYQPISIKENAPEDIAQARIRQSLDFSKNLAPRKENDLQKLTFEDADYAEQLRAKIKPSSVQGLEKARNELASQNEGNLRFSSAQELPAEKELANQQQSVTLPTHSIIENQPEKNAQIWNSPDFKQHLTQEKKAEESLPEKKAIAPAVQNQAVKMPKVYSPYIISPAHHYLAGQDEAPMSSPQLGQNDPKVKGNMVDLS